MDSLDGGVRTFAHRGASAHAPENTREAFETALAMGAGAVETDVWVTADGWAVLDHDGVFGPRFRRRKIAETARADLPAELCTMEELYEVVGTGADVSIDVKDPAAFEPLLAAARDHGEGAEELLWLCHPDLETVASWRQQTSAKLVLSTRLQGHKQLPEQLIAALRERGIDALNLRHGEWNGGLVAMAHRFERYALAWGLEHEREMAALVNVGIDGIYSNHVDRMTAVIALFGDS